MEGGCFVKEATGELNMTVITVIAIAIIGAALAIFLPGIIESIQEQWNAESSMGK